MQYSPQELEQMSLNQLAALYVDEPELEIVKEVFDAKAGQTHLFRLRQVDVKSGWQEEILQKHIESKKSEEPFDNQPQLSPSDAVKLDSSFISPTTEAELQEKLDIFRGKRSEFPKDSESLAEQEEIDSLNADIFRAESQLASLQAEQAEQAGQTLAVPIVPVAVAAPIQKKKGRPKKG